jgi:hypothetical protein
MAMPQMSKFLNNFLPAWVPLTAIAAISAQIVMAPGPGGDSATAERIRMI